LSALVAEYPALEQFLRTDVAEVRANFVTGDEAAWRRQSSLA
jgi:hypothetical protein